MIQKLILKSGRSFGAPSQTIQVDPITVFVGPNNSGKSKLLREIHRYCLSGNKDQSDVVLGNIEFSKFTTAEVEELIERRTLRPMFDERISEGRMIFGRGSARHQVERSYLSSVLQDPMFSVQQFCSWFLSWNTLSLDGQNRIGLVNQQPFGDLLRPADNPLQVLFRDDDKRLEVRRVLKEAFDQYFVIDPTSSGSLRIRLSNEPPTSHIEERGWHAEAVQFHGNALPIENASDGVKAFTAIVMNIVAGEPLVVLADEPEAFLHPSLAFKLGQEMAKAASGSGKRVLVSTHSPQFVMGCMGSGTPVSIVRLTYRGGVATSRVLENSRLLKLMRNPLLRSVGALTGLFYEFVIVTEADTDRAFYQEVNDRLVAVGDERGIPNCLFLNAQNKQTVHSIVGPLREMGIPTAAIVDIDILKDGGRSWTDFLSAANVPDLEHQPFGSLRASIKTKMDQTCKNMKRDGGIALLAGQDAEAAKNLLNRLSEYGLFVIPTGELESWLKSLNVGDHGPRWLVDMFTAMGEDPNSPTYVRPSADDVWKFIGRIKNWLIDSNRCGIPT